MMVFDGTVVVGEELGISWDKPRRQEGIWLSYRSFRGSDCLVLFEFRLHF